MLQDLPDDRFLVRPRVLENLPYARAKRANARSPSVPSASPVVVEALEALPELGAVVDHCAKPDLRTGSLDAWRAGIARVAEHPNVVCKLSGLVTEAPSGFAATALAPAVEHVLSVFGPDRLLFGSDWPVCTLATSYDRVVGVLAEIFGTRLEGDFERKLFGANAARFYGI